MACVQRPVHQLLPMQSKWSKVWKCNVNYKAMFTITDTVQQLILLSSLSYTKVELIENYNNYLTWNHQQRNCTQNVNKEGHV